MPKGIYDRSQMKKPAANGHRQPVTSLLDNPHSDDYDEDHEYEHPVAPVKPNVFDDPDAIYGTPREVTLASLEKQRIDDIWGELFDDILLRLEKTPASKALEYPFKSWLYVRRAYNAMCFRFKKHTVSGYARMITQKDPPRLYVYRGPNWRKPD